MVLSWATLIDFHFPSATPSVVSKTTTSPLPGRMSKLRSLLEGHTAASVWTGMRYEHRWPLCSHRYWFRLLSFAHFMPFSLHPLNMNDVLKLNLSMEKTGNVPASWSLQPSCVGVPNKNQPNKLSEHKLSSVL